MSRLTVSARFQALWQFSEGSLREAIESADTQLNQQFFAGESVAQLVHARAWMVEQAVLHAWDSTHKEQKDLALIATGGFGRGELHPQSDVDILVLDQRKPSLANAAARDVFVAQLWDAGLRVGHAVRTAEQCGEQALEDIATASALMESRCISGDRDLFTAMQMEIAPPQVWPLGAYLQAKVEEQQQRRKRFHDTAYNLEPNIKEGPGGLRDIQIIQWVALRYCGKSHLEDLATHGLLGAEEFQSLVLARETHWTLRWGLHFVAGRAEERLLFDYQRSVAEKLGYQDEHIHNLAVEQLMQRYFRAVQTVERLNLRLIQRLGELIAQTPPVQIPLGDGFVNVGGYLDVAPEREFGKLPSDIMQLFIVFLDNPALRGLRSHMARVLEESLPALAQGLQAEAQTQSLFMSILRHPGRVSEALQRMGRHGVLGYFLPAFARVTGRMQYDLFHVYTVDQHTLFVIRNLRRFADPSQAEAFPLACEIYPRLRKPELLLLAGLFHDIAKGRGGDHSELGVADVREFAQRVAMSDTDADLLAWLVQHHLLMSITAQRHDISDPAVVHKFAETVQDREHLDYLYLLTVADISATNPSIWNSWKDRLLADLYSGCRYALRRGLGHPVHAQERIDETKTLALALLESAQVDAADAKKLWGDFPQDSFLRYTPEQICRQTCAILRTPADRLPLVIVHAMGNGATSEVFVYSADRDGLFATITSTLDRLQLTVLEARIANSENAFSLDTFQVMEAGNASLSGEARVAEIQRRVREEVSRSELNLKPVKRAWTRQQKHFRVPVQIEFSLSSDSHRTQMSLVCSDRPGLLAHVAQAMRQAKVRVHDARIATFGERVEDFFQLTDENNQVLDEPAQQRLSDLLLTQLSLD